MMCICESLPSLENLFDSFSTISATEKTGRNAGRCFSHCSIFSFWEYLAPIWSTSTTSHQADVINSLSFIKTFMNLWRHEFPSETASKRTPDQQNFNVNITLETGKKFANKWWWGWDCRSRMRTWERKMAPLVHRWAAAVRQQQQFQTVTLSSQPNVHQCSQSTVVPSCVCFYPVFLYPAPSPPENIVLRCFLWALFLHFTGCNPVKCDAWRKSFSPLVLRTWATKLLMKYWCHLCLS